MDARRAPSLRCARASPCELNGATGSGQVHWQAQSPVLYTYMIPCSNRYCLSEMVPGLNFSFFFYALVRSNRLYKWGGGGLTSK